MLPFLSSDFAAPYRKGSQDSGYQLCRRNEEGQVFYSELLPALLGV